MSFEKAKKFKKLGFRLVLKNIRVVTSSKTSDLYFAAGALNFVKILPM